MQDLIVAINKNTIRLSTVDKDAVLKTVSSDISKDIVEDTRIISPAGLSGIVESLISKLLGSNKNKFSLSFIMEPQDIFLRYVTVSKNSEDLSEQVIKEIKEKDPNVNLEDLYFSYKKVAPFIYQFVGVRKDVMETYMEVSNSLKVGLKSVIPWVLALPKYEKVNDPAIFISKRDGDQVIALSELNGVFFTGTYRKERTPEELQGLIKELSFYKRSSPIKYIFTFNCDSFDIPGYEVKRLTCPEFTAPLSIPEGFEQNTVVNFLLDSEPEILSSQLNTLNLLPLPVVERKSSPMVIAGSIVGALLLMVGAYFGIKSLGDGSSDKSLMAQDTAGEDTQVLSESTENGSSQESDKDSTSSDVDTQTNDPNLEIKKSNLKIRVENGAGVGGLAAKTKEYLEGFGYTVLTIDTADSKTESTLLSFKKDFASQFENLIKEDLKSKFPKIEVKEGLSDDSDYDLLIIVGTSSEL